MTVILRHANGSRATLFLEGEPLPALIGAAGTRQDKSEGDMATPIGFLAFRHVFYRADRVERPVTALRIEALAPNDGWCDDPTHPDYNRQITLPHPARHEKLWREDHCYDLCVVLGWNDSPAVPGRGSAIFLHLPPTSGATEGCIALEERLLRRIIAFGHAGIEVRPD
ncbi:L,D-transpeptidase family protein [Asaia bogorensis]|uniref:L,D-transpeptidase family protein n=1 Tax=Asaia bogorensis TaxID=91915 RepID=UPI002857E6B1|nr:L,D-transpeptidase family protein [Asaia bogorensis]MDR6181826.1 L,D-peptidoglycan transpeptidase YkuD (ErfK/YbiS/YcfS/YnhG family) [Asaia bogorensis NBRC 16594]